MPLVDCPDCGTEVSSEATWCPQCGFPIKKEVGRRAQSGSLGLPRVPLTSLDVVKSIVGRIAMGGLLFASGIGFDAPPVVLLSLVILGSSVPLYLKARRAERLGVGQDAKQVEARVERRLLEAEDRTYQHLGDIDRNASRIAELEERLEFMERLLAKQRGQE